MSSQKKWKGRESKLLILLLCTALLAGHLPSVFAQDETPAVTIIHTTDAHGRTSGYPAIAALVQQHEAAGENVLLLDSGDIFHGLPEANLEQGGSIATIMREVGYDAITTGNHDYNFGVARLKELEELADTEILAANVTDEAGNLVFDAYKIWNFDGFKVAVFGIANDHTKTKTAPANTEGIQFADDIETAKAMVEELEDQVDYIVALTHIGSEVESEGTSKDLAQQVEGIDLILDGHSHNTNDGIMIGDTMLVSDGYNQESAGVVSVSRDKEETFERYAITQDSQMDEEIQQLVASVGQSQEALLAEKVGETDVFLNAEYPIVRTRETYFGDLICDAYRAQTGAQIAVENGGGIRASIPAGNITRGQVYQAFPFGNYIVTKEVSGADFVQILEDSVAEVEEIGGSFLQISGASYTYDPAKPVGERIIDVEVDEAPIDLDGVYTVATNNYVGEGFSKFETTPTLNEYASSDEALIAYLEEYGASFESDQPRITQVGMSEEYLVCLDAYVALGDVAPIVGETVLLPYHDELQQTGSTSVKEVVLLPYRATLELAGYTIAWDEEQETATAEKGDSLVSVQMADGSVAVDGETLSCAVKMVSDRILIESTAIQAALGKTVYVDEKTLSIVIL